MAPGNYFLLLKAHNRGWAILAALTAGWVIPSLACGTSHSENGFPNPTPLPLALTLSPSSIALVAGSSTAFTASPNPPPGFSLVWSISPAHAGMITSSGVYTASETAGNVVITAAWVPSNPLTGSTIAGSAKVTVLQPIALNTNLTQASGGIAISGKFQNAVIVGENLAPVSSANPTGNEQAVSGFPIPVPCPQSSPSCR